MSDPGTSYRDRSEVQEVREKKDCIHHMKKLILDSNLATEDEIKAIEVAYDKKRETIVYAKLPQFLE